MIGDFIKAVGQLGDPRFRRVFGLSIGGTLLILALLYAGWGALASSLGSPEDFTLFGYDLGILDSVLEVLAWLAGLFALSFLMMPVAALFIGFFLEEIADAVEARHYPHARGTRKSSWGEIAQDGMLFTLTLIGANLAAVILYLIVPPLGPFIFLGVNGFFLGRQYFELVAARHVTFEEARALRRANWGRVFVAGVLMAAPLAIPLFGILIPVLGVATFTHMHHRIAYGEKG